MSATTTRALCSCGDYIDGEPAGVDERGYPLCWSCATERQMAAEDWPPSPGNAFTGCLIAMLLSSVFWIGVAFLCLLVTR